MDSINENKNPEVEVQEMVMTPEQIAEMEAMKNQELFGNHVKKIGGCAVVTVEDEVIALEMPITYPQLVAAIVKRKYDADQTEAITANYISSREEGAVEPEKAEEYAAEYAAYQEWRNKAKAVAKEVMGIEA